MNKLKAILKQIPGVKQLGRLRKKRTLFSGSGDYWENRYREGGTSGSGSYGRLALFKAEVLNRFVAENKITSVLEFGCGDGHQLSLAKYPHYTGLDVSKTAVRNCRKLFLEDNSKHFFLYGEEKANALKAGLALSVDVIFHLVEDEVFERYMRDLFGAALKYVIIYSSNYDNAQSFHERERNFTRWIEENEPEWQLIQKIDNRYPYDPKDAENTSKSDFYIFGKK